MSTDSPSRFNSFDDRCVLPIRQRPMTTRRGTQLVAEGAGIAAPATTRNEDRESKPEGSEPPVLKESTSILYQATSDFPKETSVPEMKTRILSDAPRDLDGQNNKQHTTEDFPKISQEMAESPRKDPPGGLIPYNKDIPAPPMPRNGKGKVPSVQDSDREISIVTEVEFCSKDPCKNLLTQEEVPQNAGGKGKKSDCSPESVTQVEFGAPAMALSGISITQEESLPPMMELARAEEEKMEPLVACLPKATNTSQSSGCSPIKDISSKPSDPVVETSKAHPIRTSTRRRTASLKASIPVDLVVETTIAPPTNNARKRSATKSLPLSRTKKVKKQKRLPKKQELLSVNPDPVPHTLELNSDESTQKEQYVKNAAYYLASQTTHVEELAYHVYGEVPGLQDVPMLPPEDFDESSFPHESKVVWTYEPTNRIVRADFSHVSDPIPQDDLNFFSKLMQRDDLVVISKGLTMKLESIDRANIFLKYLSGSKSVFHKFRRFQRREDSGEEYDEVDGHVAMTPETYVAYLESRRIGDKKATVTFDYLGVSITAGVHDVLLYMIDADVPQLYRHLEDVYKKELRWDAIYPGGSLCMMKDLPYQMQPFMGPNLYVSPGSAYTTLHQDGLGTVDSGHSNLYGNNEVIMLRRLPETHKRAACALMPTKSQIPLSTGELSENTMYRLPHDDGRQDKQAWPTHQVVEQWRKLNYCPSVFVLKAGEHVHINKGRLHAFRKMSPADLPVDDCHFELRASHLASHPIELDVCISIAFDWMFLGVDAQGINREVSTVIENADRIRNRKTKTLAIVETCVYSMTEAASRHSLFEQFPSGREIARGVLPALEVLVQRNTGPIELVTTATLNPELRSQRVKELLFGVACVEVSTVPDADTNPATRATEPYGNDYTCKICDKELPNLYFHCEGCENLLKKDYNICVSCFSDGSFLRFTPMRDTKKRFSDLHHTGHTVENKGSRECPCKQGVCHGGCSKCRACSCKCHKVFSKRHRFRRNDQTLKLFSECVSASGNEKIQFFDETVHRLRGAVFNIKNGQ